MALGLRRTGASLGAALAYWLANPVLNPATMIFMGFVLGWRWVGLRVAAGLVLVLVVAYAANWFLRGEQVVPFGLASATGRATSDPAPLWRRWLRALWELSAGLIPEYVVIVLVLGAARAWLFPAVTPDAHGVFWTLGLAVAGTVFVIPTAGEVPIVQTLMAFGLGVGPAAALLTTLPPVSLPSLVMLAKTVPLRVLAFVGVTVAALGVLSGAAAVALGF